jgi:hypothetical protein
MPNDVMLGRTVQIGQLLRDLVHGLVRHCRLLLSAGWDEVEEV